MARYRSKPVKIDAIEWTGGNWDEVKAFTDSLLPTFWPRNEWVGAFPWEDEEVTATVYDELHDTWVGVKTGQFIIKGTKGEFYPCDPEVFREKYEEVEEIDTYLKASHINFDGDGPYTRREVRKSLGLE